MGQARLTRIDATEEMAAAVEVFRSEAIAAVEGLDMEIRRALEWIHHDRHEHWNHQVRRGWERITEARIQLQQAMTMRRVGNHDPACVDEKKALQRAQRRLEIAQEKVEAVRRHAREIDRAVDDYRGARTPLASWLESEAPKALATLRRMMADLEAYLAVQTPGDRLVDAAPSGMGFSPSNAGQPSPAAPTEGTVDNLVPDGGLKPTLQLDAADGLKPILRPDAEGGP